MTYRASHVAQRVPAAELDADAHSFHVLMTSFALLAVAGFGALAWQAASTIGIALF